MIRITFLFAMFLFFMGEVSAAVPLEDLFPETIDGIDPSKDDKLLLDYVPRIMDIFIKFIAPVVLVMLLISGGRMIISGDQQEEVEKGKKIIIYSFVGAILILLSYSLIRALYYFVLG